MDQEWWWVILVGAVVACSACNADGRTVDLATTQRDSSGIRIVESYRPSWNDGEAWRISSEPLFVIRGSDGSEENRLLDPTSIDTDSRGRIIVGDGNQAGWHAILVYDSAGGFVRQVGREGQGPGEFRQLWWAEAYRGDSLIAFDMGNDRISVFSADGSFVRQLSTPRLRVPDGPRGSRGYTDGIDAAYRDGTFLAYPRGRLEPGDGAGPAWYRHLLLRLSPDGAAWDTLGSFEISQQFWTGSEQKQYWFGPIAVSAVSDNELFFGRGDRFEFMVYDSVGSLSRIVRRPHEVRVVTPELREQLVEWFVDLVVGFNQVSDETRDRVRVDVERAEFAEVLPPYSALILDDSGHVWVEEFRWMLDDERAPVQTAASWSVFDPQGVWLGQVMTPEGFIMHDVQDTRVLGFMIDEFGVKEIYVYALDRGR